jgi:Ca-activated chloride channel family protein
MPHAGHARVRFLLRRAVACLVAAVVAGSLVGAAQNPAASKPELTLQTRLVTCDVSLQDDSGRYVAGLERGAFTVLEDGVPQEIAFFSTGDEPITIGIVLDVSGSMEKWFAGAVEALEQFADTCAPGDEFFVITFADRPALVCDFTRDAKTAFSSLVLAAPKGDTSLVDAAMLGLEKARRGAHRRHALLIISDGQDNNSRYSFEELRDVAAEADTLVYSIGIVDMFRRGPGGAMQYDPDARLSSGRNLLKAISESSGGRAFHPGSVDALREACIDIALELRSQYRIGYYPTDASRDARFRRIRVAVAQGPREKRYRVRARKGYYPQPPHAVTK